MTLRRTAMLLLTAYTLLTFYILSAVAFGLPFSPVLTPISTTLAFSFAVLHAGDRLGWGRALLLLGLTFAVALLFESLGVATGLVYGPYHYTDLLGPKFLGLVPYLIPLAWFMMMYPAFLMAGWLLPRGLGGWRQVLLWAGMGGVIMTAWDLVMDPMMVSGGHWIWEVDGAYFGVPIQNYWGWWLTVFVTFALFLVLARPAPDLDAGPAEPGWERLALASYAVTGLSSVISAALLDLEGPALVGLFAMLPWVVTAWWRVRPHPQIGEGEK